MAMTHEEKFIKFYCTAKGRAGHLYNNAFQRSKKMNIPFDLDRQWIIDKIAKGVCEVTGIPFVIRKNGGRGHKNNSFSPSLDRIDPNKGYVKGNVQVVCWIYNRAKGAFPLDDLKRMAHSLAEPISF